MFLSVLFLGKWGARILFYEIDSKSFRIPRILINNIESSGPQFKKNFELLGSLFLLPNS
jgi:hypothetical protein